MGPRTQDQDWPDESELEPAFEPAEERPDVRHSPDARSWARLADYEETGRTYLE